MLLGHLGTLLEWPLRSNSRKKRDVGWANTLKHLGYNDYIVGRYTRRIKAYRIEHNMGFDKEGSRPLDASSSMERNCKTPVET